MSHGRIVIGIAEAVVSAAVAFDYVRLRLQRSNGCPTCAQLAADALADGCVVDDVHLPDVGDARWKKQLMAFGAAKRDALVLGNIIVDPVQKAVFVGTGLPSLQNGKDYVERVVKAYNQRLADASMKGTP